jgi:hypothetical protein
MQKSFRQKKSSGETAAILQPYQFVVIVIFHIVIVKIRQEENRLVNICEPDKI